MTLSGFCRARKINSTFQLSGEMERNFLLWSVTPERTLSIFHHFKFQPRSGLLEMRCHRRRTKELSHLRARISHLQLS
jgi:hypothetical protein